MKVTAQGLRLAFLALLMVLTMASSSQARVFYVDAERGNDDAEGGKETPWRSVAKVNRTPLPHGSVVRFKAGQSFGPDLLVPQSGSAGNRITYTSYGTGKQPRLPGVSAAGKSHLTLFGLSLSSATTVVDLAGASHVTVEKCRIVSSATQWAPAITINSDAHHNRILNNSITQSEAKNDTINLRGNADRNLIEGNTIRISGIHCAIALEGHTGGGTADYNIIRNNVLIAEKGGGALIALHSNSNHNVVEGNILSGASSMSGHCGSNEHARHQTIFNLVSMNNIVRNNIIKNYPCKDSLGLDMSAFNSNGFTNIASGNHVYHNVITGILVGGTPLFLGENGTGGKSINNVFKNNIIYNNGGSWYQSRKDGSWPRASHKQQMKVQVSLNVRDNLFVNNIFYRSDESRILWLNDAFYTVEQVQSWNGRLFQRNLQTDPRLDPKTQRPLKGSPVTDAAAPLTTVISASGSGDSLTVEDPYYFSDGFGVVEGDTVQVGKELVGIKQIDYASRTLTLARSISWREGAPVTLPYLGNGPDIGAFEAGAPTLTVADRPLPRSAGKITAR
jgi:hypothetical protein